MMTRRNLMLAGLTITATMLLAACGGDSSYSPEVNDSHSESQMENQAGMETENQIDSQTGNQAEDQLENQTEEQTEDQVEEQGESQAENQIPTEETQVENQTESQTGNQTTSNANTPVVENRTDNQYQVRVYGYSDSERGSIGEFLNEIEMAEEVDFHINYENSAAQIAQIFPAFSTGEIDLTIAKTMQTSAGEITIPVVCVTAADDWNPDDIMNLTFEMNEDMRKMGLLYNNNDKNNIFIASVKEYLDSMGVRITESTGANVEEMAQAAINLIADDADIILYIFSQEK